MRRTTHLLAFAMTLLAGPASHASTDTPRVVLPGAIMEIRFTGTINERKAAELVDWLRDTANQVSAVSGSFPVPEPKVNVIATSGTRWSRSPVPFGRVTRRGGQTVELYVDVTRPIEDLYADWTASHEFSHLMLPRINWRQRWISEGFASYYQNVLMTRAGHYSPDEGLRRLSAGLERGRASRPELSPNAAALEGISRARMKIYWSGAALALLADLEIRERSNGRDSLDAVLGRFQACCLPSDRRWSGTELMNRLDSLLDEPVFVPLYRRHADAVGFPDVTAALANERLRDEIFTVRTSPN
ncbi:MAG: hypothetical protein QNJ14_08895 [Woeseiaceae bacterium]|nr:hypothetical protein [Woeseiaceae bacterium]